MRHRPYTIKPPNMSPARQPLRNISNRLSQQKHSVLVPFHKQEMHKPSMHKIQQKMGEESCTNHPNKLAQFKAVSEQEDLFYCEKCAILLASQGFKVIRLSAVSLRTSKVHGNGLLQHSRQFLDQVEHSLVDMANKLQSLAQQKTEFEGYFESLLTNIDTEEEQYHKRVTVSMNQQRRIIERSSQQYSQKYKAMVDSLNKRKRQLENVAEDIQCNLEIIVYLDGDEYYPIMNQYQQTLNSSRETLLDTVSLQPSQPILMKQKCVCGFNMKNSTSDEQQEGKPVQQFSFDAKKDSDDGESERLRVSELEVSGASDNQQEDSDPMQTPHL